jgi:crotonobetainyl-CoA:carnitine CoA-transferase CaiB-like acyl-CoA transferase
VYACKDDKHIALSGSMQSMAMRIFDTIGRPELKIDTRFHDNDARVQNKDALDAILQDFIGSKTQEENLNLFEQAGVTAGPVCSVADLIDHPFVVGREAIINLEDAELGSVAMHNIIPRLSASPGGFTRPAPQLGEHTADVLAEIEHITLEQEKV